MIMSICDISEIVEAFGHDTNEDTDAPAADDISEEEC